MAVKGLRMPFSREHDWRARLLRRTHAPFKSRSFDRMKGSGGMVRSKLVDGQLSQEPAPDFVEDGELTPSGTAFGKRILVEDSGEVPVFKERRSLEGGGHAFMTVRGRMGSRYPFACLTISRGVTRRTSRSPRSTT